MTEEKEGDPLTVEKFHGWIERIHDGTAYLTLTDSKGRDVEAECKTSQLEPGLDERDDIEGTMEYLDNGETAMIFHPAPMLEEEEWQTLRKEKAREFEQVRQGRLLPSQVALEKLLAKVSKSSVSSVETDTKKQDK